MLFGFLAQEILENSEGLPRALSRDPDPYIHLGTHSQLDFSEHLSTRMLSKCSMSRNCAEQWWGRKLPV